VFCSIQDLPRRKKQNEKLEVDAGGSVCHTIKALKQSIKRIAMTGPDQLYAFVKVVNYVLHLPLTLPIIVNDMSSLMLSCHLPSDI
jgi:hypothetical protein